jgi:ABC-type branched-subunit amino acid transport system substrate-binding protein
MTAEKPDLLLTGYFDDVVSTVMRQAVELGVTKKFIGMRGVSEKPGVTMGNAIDSYMWPVATRSVVNPEDPEGKAYVASFAKYLGRAPDPSMAPGVGYHDVVWMLAAAMTKAGTTTDLEKIRSALQSGQDYPHATLHLTFDANGQVDYPQTYGTYDGATGELTFSVSK